MGLGIAIDVAIATLAQFRDRTMSLKTWTLPVTITHILFPAAGYYSWWLLGETQPLLLVPLGLIAFGLITLYLFETFCDSIDRQPPFSISDRAKALLPKLREVGVSRTLMILAVSMDALWSGPAKAAQTVSGDWSAALVLVSFVLAGLVVATVAQLALVAARTLYHVRFSDNSMLALVLVVAKYWVFVILGGFGVLSLWNAFSFQLGLGNLFTSMTIAAIIFAPLWGMFWGQLLIEQEREVAEMHALEEPAA